MTKDLLDMEKYRDRGAYHWDYYARNFKDHKTKTDLLVSKLEKKLQPYDDIVDIGCGDGLLTALLTEKGYTVFGIDANPLAIKLAKVQGLTNVTACSIYDYDQTHDVALLIDSFEHFDKPELAVQVLNKHIKKSLLILNPLWESEKYHHDYYDEDKLSKLFKEHWTLDSDFRFPPAGKDGDKVHQLLHFTKREQVLNRKEDQMSRDYMKVDIDVMNKARGAEDRAWVMYNTEISPDDRLYLKYHEYLALKWYELANEK